MNDSIQPLGSRVLIEVVEEEGVTASGLVIPDTAKEKQQKGLVVAVGDDEEIITVKVGEKVLFPKYTGTVVDDDEIITVKVGEKVLFPKYTGTEISQDGHEFLIIDATELLAVFGRSAS